MEFSQRPAHPGVHHGHGFVPAAAPAAPTHYSYAASGEPKYFAEPGYAGTAQSQQQRRLPSVSELLVSQQAAQQQVALQHQHYQQQHQQQQQQQQMVPPAMYSPTAADVQKSYAIDVPQRRQAPDAAGYHRDSESSSSVSSQGTLLESYSPQTHQRAFAKHGAEYRPSTRIFAPTQQQHVATAAAIHVQPELAAGAGMCEEDVYAAASILMSLRTCKMPC